MSAPALLPDTLPGIDEMEQHFADSSIPCQTRDSITEKPCEHPADWRITMSCCGYIGFQCDMHFQFFLAHPDAFVLVCQQCDTRHYHVSDAVRAAYRL